MALSVIVALITLSAFAAENPDNDWWYTAENQVCQVYFPSEGYEQDYSLTWNGACVDGKASGYGRMVHWQRNGLGLSYREGVMRGGKFQDRVITLADPGSITICEWRDSRVSGGCTIVGWDKNCEFRDGVGVVFETCVDADGRPIWREGNAGSVVQEGTGGESGQETGEQPSVAGWITAENQPCQIWNPYPKPGETVTWTGGCVDGKASGTGRMVWRGSYGEGVYEGELRDGKTHGHGTYTWADGGRYEGEYRDGKRHGHGTYTWADGDRAEGVWRDGKKHGFFTETYTGGGGSTCEYLNGELITSTCEFY